MARAGLFDVRANKEGAVDHIGRARFDAAENLGPLVGAATQVEHPHLVGVADLGVDDGEVAEGLQGLGLDRQRNLACPDLNDAGDAETRPPAA